MKRMKSKVSLLFATAMLLVFVFAVSTVQAATEPKLQQKSLECELVNPPIDYAIVVEGVTKTSQISSLKNSNKKVASVEVRSYEKYVYLNVTPKKVGKTKISFDVKYVGKTKTLTLAVNVKKYKNVMKSLKIGSKSYTSKFKKGLISEAKIKKLKNQKITVKAISGWKLESIQVESASGTKIIKNGKKIGVSSGAFYITFKNKKTKEYKTYGFYANFS